MSVILFVTKGETTMFRHKIINLVFFFFIVLPNFLDSLPMPYFSMQSARRLLRRAISQRMVESYKKCPEQFCVQPGKQSNGSPHAYTIQTKEQFPQKSPEYSSISTDRIHEIVSENKKSLHELARIARATKAVKFQKKGRHCSSEKPYFNRRGNLAVNIPTGVMLQVSLEGGFAFPVP